MNQNLAMFGQMAGQGAPMPPPQQAPGAPMGGARPPMPAPLPPGGGPAGASAAAPGGSKRYTPQEMAALGRFGDQIVAHLTPGEIEVPPEVQSPKVLATLKTAFNKNHVDISQFTAGSQNSSHNPNTGAPEYSFWSALLPILGATGGFFLGGPMGAAAGGALGGGIGGGVVDKGGLQGGLLGAALGGAGGYFGGEFLPGLLGGGGAAAAGGTGAITADAAVAAGLDPAIAASMSPAELAALGTSPATGLTAAESAAGASSAAPSMIDNALKWVKANPFKAAVLGGGAAMTLPGMFGSQQSQAPQLPPGFNTPLTPMSQLNTPGGYLTGNSNYNPFARA